MTSWSRRLSAADRQAGMMAVRPTTAGDPLAPVLALGVSDDDMAAVRALAVAARDRAGFRSRLTVRGEDGADHLVEVAHGDQGPVVRTQPAGPARADDGEGAEVDPVIRYLTDTLVETPDLVAVFASVGHEAVWANDAFVTNIPVRADDGIWLIELLDEWSKGHYEVKVLPALVKYGRWRGRLTLLAGDGELPASVAIVAHRDRQGEIEAVSMVARDLGGQTASDEASAREGRFATLVESAAEIIVVAAPDGRVQYASPAALRLVGLAEDGVSHAFDLLELVHPDDRPESLLDLVRPDDQGIGVALDLRLLVGDEVRHLEVIATDLTENPEIHGVVLNIRDVSTRVLASQALAEQAYTDPLTGLPNRIRLLDRLERIVQDDPAAPVAVLMIDLDHFVAVNERLGPEVGDLVIEDVARRLRDGFSEPALVARHSGDQFVVVLPGVHDGGEAVRLGNRARQLLAAPLHVAGEAVELQASVGVVVSVGRPAEQVLGDAARAMAFAKEAGRDRVELFREELAEAAGRRQAMEQHLRHALDNDGVAMHYQPVVEVGTRAVVAAEALLRVHEPGGDVLSPAALVEAAESTGLITRLGGQVLQVAAEQLAAWTDVPDVPDQISVNVSPRQLSDPALPSRVHDALSSAGVAPERLWLELSESILISPQPAVDAALSYLQALGVRVGLDDFGAGKSSLGYLKRFPLDFVKIDRTLVAGLGVDEQDTAIVRATIDLAHNLGLTVVAVGVETEEQLEILELLGCDLAQGYLFAPPAPASSFPHAASA